MPRPMRPIADGSVANGLSARRASRRLLTMCLFHSSTAAAAARTRHRADDGAMNAADIGAEQQQIDVDAVPILKIEALLLNTAESP